jgi:hypothetical protein
MGQDDDSELWLPMGLLFIPHVIYIYIYIYEHGEPWWNDVSKGKLLIHPPELSGNPTSSHLVVNQEELGEGDEFGLMKHLHSYFRVIFYVL